MPQGITQPKRFQIKKTKKMLKKKKSQRKAAQGLNILVTATVTL